MKTPTIHLAFGVGVRCDYRDETLNATTDLDRVTCRRCLRHRIQDWTRNVALYQRWIDHDLVPPVMVGDVASVAEFVPMRDNAVQALADVWARLGAVSK